MYISGALPVRGSNQLRPIWAFIDVDFDVLIGQKLRGLQRIIHSQFHQGLNPLMVFTKASVSCFPAGKIGGFSAENLAQTPLIMVNCHIVSYKRREANRNVIEA